MHNNVMVLLQHYSLSLSQYPFTPSIRQNNKNRVNQKNSQSKDNVIIEPQLGSRLLVSASRSPPRLRKAVRELSHPHWPASLWEAAECLHYAVDPISLGSGFSTLPPLPLC